MSFKYPKNVIVIVSVVAALLAGTVLLGGYANSKPADTQAPAKACQAKGNASGCPMMAAQAESTGCSKTPCTESCPKPCCAEDSDGCCDNPCPIPCPKPCCAEDAPKSSCGTAEAKGCCAVEAAAQ